MKLIFEENSTETESYGMDRSVENRFKEVQHEGRTYVKIGESEGKKLANSERFARILGAICMYAVLLLGLGIPLFFVNFSERLTIWQKEIKTGIETNVHCIPIDLFDSWKPRLCRKPLVKSPDPIYADKNEKIKANNSRLLLFDEKVKKENMEIDKLLDDKTHYVANIRKRKKDKSEAIITTGVPRIDCEQKFKHYSNHTKTISEEISDVRREISFLGIYQNEKSCLDKLQAFKKYLIDVENFQGLGLKHLL